MTQHGLRIGGVPLIPEMGGDDETSKFMQIGMLFYLFSLIVMLLWGISLLPVPHRIGSGIAIIVFGILSFIVYLHEYTAFYKPYLENKMNEVMKRMHLEILLGLIFGLILGGFLFLLAYLNIKHPSEAPYAHVAEATPLCKNCGAEVPRGTFVCPVCGTDHRKKQ